MAVFGKNHAVTRTLAVPTHRPLRISFSFRPLMKFAAVVAGVIAVALVSAPAQASDRKSISKEAPVFPSDALDEGITSGTVKAKISVGADGSVSNVEIVDANPKRVFDKAVSRAVMRWKYEPGSAEVIDVQLTFKGH